MTSTSWVRVPVLCGTEFGPACAALSASSRPAFVCRAYTPWFVRKNIELIFCTSRFTRLFARVSTNDASTKRGKMRTELRGTEDLCSQHRVVGAPGARRLYKGRSRATNQCRRRLWISLTYRLPQQSRPQGDLNAAALYRVSSKASTKNMRRTALLFLPSWQGRDTRQLRKG